MVDKTLSTVKELQLQGGRFTVECDGKRSTLVVGAEPVLAGRDPACQISLDDAGVSAVHAELVATERGVRIRDLGSKNGVWVGDVRMTEAFVSGKASVWLGRAELVFDVASTERIELPEVETFGPLYGRSATMRDLFRRVQKAAPTDLTVLIEGETGTGKELVAQALHNESRRKNKPFIVVDCGAISPTLAESTLFGHERGAFTGAESRRASPFVEADGGTVFLDELGELPLDIQPKLLRALAERRIKPVGGNTYRELDVRVVAATRRELVKAVNTGAFRSDLYFRVAQVRVEVPPLRARVEDIPGLVKHMLKDVGAASAYRRVSRATLERLLRHDWPGNVRELKNAVSVALALTEEGAPLDIAAHVGLPGRSGRLHEARDPTNARNYHDAKRDALDHFERAYFASLVDATRGNLAEISRRAGLQRYHVRRYLQRHGLRERPQKS